MAESERCGVFNFDVLGDQSRGISGIRSYGNSIINYLRTPQYDALLLGYDRNSAVVTKRLSQNLAIVSRITSGALSMKGIIAAHALETVREDSESAAAIHTDALKLLAQCVRDGVDLRIATPDTYDIIHPEVGDFSLIEYENGPGQLVIDRAEKHLIEGIEGPETMGWGFEPAEQCFARVWEAPSTVQPQAEVIDFITDTAARLNG